MPSTLAASLRRVWFVLAALALFAGGCADSTANLPDEPGDDTAAQDDTTAPRPDGDEDDTGADTASADTDAGDDTLPPTDTAQGDTSVADLDADTAGPRPVEPPPKPDAGDRVEHITVTIRTATSMNAQTDDGARICFGASQCFGLDVPTVNDREQGNTEVYHFDGLDLTRADLDALTLETTSSPDVDNDRWTPECIDVRFDGEPVYCNDAIPVHIGTGASMAEVASWTDPAGLHEACTTCWGSTVTHGPLLGPPTTESVRMAVRTDATRLTGVRIGDSEDLSTAPVLAWAWPPPTSDFTADLEVGGLQPDTEYFYQLEVDGELVGPARAIRTAPPSDSERPLRISFGSCSNTASQPIFGPILDHDPDLFLFVGDNNYANTHHRDALRWHYRRALASSHRADFVANRPILATWDDHDFLANNSNGTCLARDVALGAFEEYWANPTHGLPATPGTFFNTRYGAAEIFMLDCRMYRPDVGDTSNRCEPDPDPPTLSISDGPLGLAQEAWFLEALQASTATFKLVACGSRWSPNGSLDSWRSFPAARDRILDAIDTHDIGGVVFLAGDIHKSLFAELDAPAYMIPELVSSPLALSSPNPCNASQNAERLCVGATNAWVEIDINPALDDPELRAKIYDETGAERGTWLIRRSQLQ